MRRCVHAIATAGAIGLVGCGAADRGQASSGRSMGSLVGREARLHIVASPVGPRYDVWSPDGRLLAAGLTSAEAGAMLPDQDPRGAWAESMPLGLMLADERRVPGID